MNTNLFLKGLAGVAVAAVLLPVAASAHGLEIGGKGDMGGGLHIGGLHLGFGTNASTTVGVKHGDNDQDNDNDGDRGEHIGIGMHASTSASTTAAGITKRATRLEAVADFITSLGSTIEARIASTSAGVTASTSADLTALNSNAASGKAQAQAAINLVSGSTTDTTVFAQANADLKAARGFLSDARKNLMSLFHTLLSFTVGGSASTTVSQ